MSRRLETALDESLARLNKGESIESCLEHFPEFRGQLEPLLQVGGRLSRMAAQTAPSEEAVARARRRFMAEVYERRATQVSPKRRPFWVPVLQRGVATASVVVALIVVLLTGTGIVSANSLPGDPLYGIKLASENVRIWLTPDSESRVLLRSYYDSLRVAEVKQVLEKGRETQVSFTGVVERVEGNTLIVQGIPVQISAIQSSEPPVPGAKVQVVAQTQSDGTVAANSVDIEPADELPSPIQSPTMAQAAIETATATALPAAATPTTEDKPSRKTAATATESAAALPTATEPPAATSTALPVMTATVAPSDTALPTQTLAPTVTPTATATRTLVPQPRDIPVRIEGRIDEIGDDYWRVDGQRINLRSSTEINETAAPAQVGGRAIVKALKKPDGTLIAQQITVVRGPEQTPVIQEFSGIIESIAADHWIIAGRRVDIVAETAIDGQPKLGLLARVQAELKPGGMLVAKAIKVEPQSGETVQIEGLIEKLEEDYWIVAGREIWLDPETEITGTPALGAIAEVEAVVRADGKHWAVRIEIQEEEAPTQVPTEEPTEAPTAMVTQTEVTPAAEDTPGPSLTATVESATPLPTVTVTSGVGPESTASVTIESPTVIITLTETLEATATLVISQN